MGRCSDPVLPSTTAQEDSVNARVKQTAQAPKTIWRALLLTAAQACGPVIASLILLTGTLVQLFGLEYEGPENRAYQHMQIAVTVSFVGTAAFGWCVAVIDVWRKEKVVSGHNLSNVQKGRLETEAIYADAVLTGGADEESRPGEFTVKTTSKPKSWVFEWFLRVPLPGNDRGARQQFTLSMVLFALAVGTGWFTNGTGSEWSGSWYYLIAMAIVVTYFVFEFPYLNLLSRPLQWLPQRAKGEPCKCFYPVVSGFLAPVLVVMSCGLTYGPVANSWDRPAKYVRWHPTNLNYEAAWRGIFAWYVYNLVLGAITCPMGPRNALFFGSYLPLSSLVHAFAMFVDSLRDLDNNGNVEHMYGDILAWFLIGVVAALLGPYGLGYLDYARLVNKW